MAVFFVIINVHLKICLRISKDRVESVADYKKLCYSIVVNQSSKIDRYEEF